MNPGPRGYPPRPQHPYPPAPPYYPPQPYGYGYPYAPPPATDHRAVASLALGVLSLSCGGFVLGIPAIFFGFSARKHIERSGGAMTGAGMALGGIITGFLSTALSIVLIAAFAISAALGSRTGHLAGASSHPVPPGVAHRATIGKVDVVQLSTSEGSLRDQIASELARARGAKKTLIVQTTATWCSVCEEIDDALPDARMQGALENVEIVRVDIDDFRAELMLQKMFEKTVPWFYKVDSTARPTDAISADEWDENVPENMAPVLKAFADGTLTKRRNASQIGTPL